MVSAMGMTVIFIVSAPAELVFLFVNGGVCYGSSLRPSWRGDFSGGLDWPGYPLSSGVLTYKIFSP